MSAVCLWILAVQAAGESASITSPKGDHYWQLGVGAYFGGCYGRFTELDAARCDWVYLCYGNIGATEETTELLNRMLALNPRLRIVIRVWPIMGLTPHKENRHQATMYDYFYLPGVKEKVLEETRRQIRIVLDNISKPENVVGLTFLEELPGHFTDNMIDVPNGGKSSWAIEAYRKEIEAELGKPFVWNDETRRWWCSKYVQALSEIHAVMKEASGGRLVFYYQQTNHFNLDHADPGMPVETPNLIPIHLAEIIKPGLCDGFFGYPNNTHLWETQTLQPAKKHGRLFFSQLPHGSTMRLGAWEECVKLAKTKVPQNLGYFWYCEGDCIRNIWNDDHSIPFEETGPGRNYYVEHSRRFLAQQQVGMDVIERNLKPELAFDYTIKDAKRGDFQPVWVQVHNTRDASWFVDPNEATLRDVRVKLTVPGGADLPRRNSPPAELALGDIEADGYRAVLWWAQMKETVTVSQENPMRARLTAANAPSVELTCDLPDVTSQTFQSREICRSGDSWIEPTYRVAEPLSPIIRMQPLGVNALRPAVANGAETIAYGGTLHNGEELVIGPGLKGRLNPTSLILTEDLVLLADPAGQHGTKGWSEGYHILNLRLMNPSRPGAKLRVTISGKVSGGAGSQVLLNGFHAPSKERWSEALLVNVLKEDWQEGISQEIVVPEDVVLQNVLCYRRENKGTIWYGDVSVTLSNLPASGIDVSDRLEGSVPSLTPGTFTRFTYSDGSAPSQMPRLRVQLCKP